MMFPRRPILSDRRLTKGVSMPKFIVELKETRTFKVEIEATDEDAAYELAEEIYPEASISDQFDSVERHSIVRV